jgi:hypothetical protein
MEEQDCLRTYLLLLCQPFQFRPPWDFLTPQRNVRRGPADPDGALTTLLDRHPVETLVSCGLVGLDAEGTPALNPLLRAPGGPLIAVMDPENTQPVDIVTPDGCLRSDERPLFAMLYDGFNRRLLQSESLYLLTATLEDAIAARTLGFPAAPIRGLDNLRSDEVDRLVECFALRREDDVTVNPSGAGATKPQLIIINCSLLDMDLSEPETARRGIQYLGQLHDFRRLDIDGVGVWQPSAEDFKAIEFAVGRREAEWVFEALCDSLENAPILEMLLNSQSREPASLVDPMGAILGVPAHGLLGEPSPVEQAKARQRYEQAISERLIAPLVAEADAAVDLFQRRKWLRLAELIDLSNAKMRQARQLTQQAILGTGDPSGRGKDKSVPEVLALDKEIESLARSIHKSPRNR